MNNIHHVTNILPTWEDMAWQWQFIPTTYDTHHMIISASAIYHASLLRGECPLYHLLFHVPDQCDMTNHPLSTNIINNGGGEKINPVWPRLCAYLGQENILIDMGETTKKT